MISRLIRAFVCISLLFLDGCSSLAPLLIVRTPTPVPVLKSTSTPQPTPSPTPPTAVQPRILRVWLPPQFDPNADTPASEIFNQRLLEFETNHPGLEVEIRVKSETAEVDILDILSTTYNAAPAAMPDLVALTYSDMQSAASAGFLHPLEGLTNVLQDPDWYPVAREFGHYQNSEFGLPFASDALLTVYRPAAFDPPPSAWDAVFESGSYAAFPASDPKALFFLDLYLSAGGELTNDQGAIILDEELVIQVLSFFKEGLDKGAIPPEIKDHQTDVQTLQYFRGGYADLVVVSVTSDLATKSGQYMPVLGLNNLHYSLADGWVWSLAGADAEKLPVAAELAAYLVDSEYMSIWTKSAGYLPTRPQALAGWEEEDLETSLNEVLQSAHPVPLDQVLTVVGPLLQEAVVRVFNGEQVQVVARSVIESIQ